MSFGEKIADSIPDSVIEHIARHPRSVRVLTVAIVAFSVYNLMRALELDDVAKRYIADAQLARSEALGG